MIAFKLVIISLVAFNCLSSTISVEFSIISAVLKSLQRYLDQPLEWSLHLCWEPSQIVTFINDLSRGSQHLTRSGRISESDLPQGVSEVALVIVMDLNCPETLSLLKDLNWKRYEGIRWIFLNAGLDESNPLVSQLLGYVVQNKMSTASEVFYITEASELRFIKQAYHIDSSPQPVTETFATWNRTDSSLTDHRSTPITSRRRKNLNGINLRGSMVILKNDSLNHLDDYRDIHRDTIAKMNYVLTNHMVSYLNATINFTMVDNWGYRDKDTGDWSGMIGELVRDEADVGATACFFTIERIPFVQFVAMTTKSKSIFVFRSPKLSFTDNIFLLPFSDIVWLCIVCVIPVIGISLALVSYTEYKLEIKRHENIDKQKEFYPTLLESFNLVYGAFCQQGSAFVPTRISARILMFIAFLVLFFLYSSYSANVVALLQAPSNKIKSLEDLLGSRLKVSAEDNVFQRFYFARQTETTRRLLYEQKMLIKNKNNMFLPLTSGVENIRKGLFAFHMEAGPGYKLISETFTEDEKCSLQEIGGYLQMFDPYYAIRKNSTYKEMIKVGLFRIYEHGLQFRENTRFYPKKPTCSGTGGTFESVSTIDIQPALYLMLYGLSIAFTSFIIELMVKKHKKVYGVMAYFRPKNMKNDVVKMPTTAF